MTDNVYNILTLHFWAQVELSYKEVSHTELSHKNPEIFCKLLVNYLLINNRNFLFPVSFFQILSFMLSFGFNFLYWIPGSQKNRKYL